MQYMMGEIIRQEGEELFRKYKVANLTFDGVDSPLLHMGDFDGDLGQVIGQVVNSSFPYGKFGWLYGVI